MHAALICSCLSDSSHFIFFVSTTMDGFLQPGMAQTCSTMKATLDARIRSLQRLKHNPDVSLVETFWPLLTAKSDPDHHPPPSCHEPWTMTCRCAGCARLASC